MKYIELTQGERAMVDDEDYEDLIKYKWKVLFTKTKCYASQSGTLKNGRMLMHRMIMNTPKGLVTDHIDGDGLNNQRSNLRICTTSQNMQNCGVHKNNTSGFKGVQFDKRRGKYIARIRINDTKRIHTKQHDTAELAYKEYCELAKEHHGEFARLL